MFNSDCGDYQDHSLSEISEVVEATSKQHDNTQVDIAAAQRAKRKNVHIVFAKTYFSQGAFRFTAKSGLLATACAADLRETANVVAARAVGLLMKVRGLAPWLPWLAGRDRLARMLTWLLV